MLPPLQVDLFVDFQRLFNMPTAEWANLAAVESLWQKRHDLWSTLPRAALKFAPYQASLGWSP